MRLVGVEFALSQGHAYGWKVLEEGDPARVDDEFALDLFVELVDAHPDNPFLVKHQQDYAGAYKSYHPDKEYENGFEYPLSQKKTGHGRANRVWTRNLPN
jgi:hypothetical protein